MLLTHGMDYLQLTTRTDVNNVVSILHQGKKVPALTHLSLLSSVYVNNMVEGMLTCKEYFVNQKCFPVFLTKTYVVYVYLSLPSIRNFIWISILRREK